MTDTHSAYETITGRTHPFAFLTGEQPDLPTSAVVAEKKRGRPRKHHPNDGKIHHRMDDNEPVRVAVVRQQSVVDFFQLSKDEQELSIRQRVDMTAKKFDITYGHAWSLVSDSI